MKSTIFVALFTLLFAGVGVAQNDTIYADNKEIVPVYKKVTGPDDWENVSITRRAKEVKDFRQVGLVNGDMPPNVALVVPVPALISGPLGIIGAIGTVVNNARTISTTTGKVKKRIFRRLQMQCAMSGGNLIHVTQLDSISNLSLGIVNRSAEMTVAGISYTTIALDAGDFRAKLKGKTTFTCVEKIEMTIKDSEFTKSQFDSVFNLSYVVSESDLLYAIGSLNNVHTGQFRVTGFTDKQFILMRKVRSTIYNYLINF